MSLLLLEIMRDKEKLKKTLLRFLKDKGIYSFIMNETNKEYNHNFNAFADKICDYGVAEIFNRRDILSFDWGVEEKFNFWSKIHNEWVKICRENYCFRVENIPF